MRNAGIISLAVLFVMAGQARGIQDIYQDGYVYLLDFAIFAKAWKSQPGDDNWNPACDISEPNDDVIDERDLAVLADNWLSREPTSITYQIDYCDLGAGQSSASVAESEDLRFSVTVQGRCIHFEDMMVANCCATKVWLEMEVDNNQITIYEREAGGVCFCICDYPVTATLGPFEPGTYTLEVYQKEGYGGFIGSTTVTIE